MVACRRSPLIQLNAMPEEGVFREGKLVVVLEGYDSRVV